MKTKLLLASSLLICLGGFSQNEIITQKIGQQEWMTKDLQVSTFSNGDKIMKCENEYDWKYALENKQPAFEIKDGKYFYNYYAIIDSRNLAPIGFHIPNSYDLAELHEFIKGDAGKLMQKKSVTDTWPMRCENCKNWTDDYRRNHGGCSVCKDSRQNGTYRKTFTASSAYNMNIEGNRWVKDCFSDGFIDISTFELGRSPDDLGSIYKGSLPINNFNWYDSPFYIQKRFVKGYLIVPRDKAQIRCIKGASKIYDAHQEIKTQIWMAGDLNISTFSNGDSLFFATNRSQWEEAFRNQIPAFCFYEFDSNNHKLYNYFAVTDYRGLAPQGWRITTKNDWEILLSNFRYPKEQFKKEIIFMKDGKFYGYKNKGYFNGNSFIKESTTVWWCSDNDVAFEFDAVNFKEKGSGYPNTNTYSENSGFLVRCVKMSKEELRADSARKKEFQIKVELESKIKLLCSNEKFNEGFDEILNAKEKGVPQNDIIYLYNSWTSVLKERITELLKNEDINTAKELIRIYEDNSTKIEGVPQFENHWESEINLIERKISILFKIDEIKNKPLNENEILLSGNWDFAWDFVYTTNDKKILLKEAVSFNSDRTLILNREINNVDVITTSTTNNFAGYWYLEKSNLFLYFTTKDGKDKYSLEIYEIDLLKKKKLMASVNFKGAEGIRSEEVQISGLKK